MTRIRTLKLMVAEWLLRLADAILATEYTMDIWPWTRHCGGTSI